MTYSNLVDATGLEYFFDLIYLKYLQFIGTSVQQEAGKGLSSNDYTTTEKNKLSGIASGAQVNVIETVKVNGSALTITDKAVDITVPTNYLTASDITDMATKTWVGQQNYLTSHQSLSGYATETWVNSKLNDILGVNADAVSSLIAVLSDNDAQTGILNMIAGKADSSSLATVATSGSYNDLTNKPTLFSGSYDDLTNKPTIPSAYTLPIASSSVLGGVKIGTGLSINSETGVLSATVQDISGKANISDLSTVAFSGSYNDLLNKPTLADAQVQADWTESDSTSKAYILHKPSIYTQTEIDTMLANVPFMGEDDGSALIADNYVNVTEGVVIVSSNSVPTSSTTTYTDAFGTTRTFKVGDQMKVYNSSKGKYDIYILYNLSNNTATWEESNNVTVTNTVNVNLATYVNGVNTIGTDLIGVVVTLTNTTDSEVVDTHTIVSGETSCSFTELNPLKDYSVSVSSIAGYTQPAAQTISEIGVGVSVTKTFQYQADEYTIAITSDQGASDPAISEAVVTINGTDYENGDTVKIATGTSQSDIESAISTTSINRYNNAVTVNTTNKTITSAYTYVPLGNFIFERKGGLYTAAQWTAALNNGEVSNDDVIGIAVLTEEHNLMISTESLGTIKVCSSDSTTPTGMTGIATELAAKSDFAGEANTLLMMNTYGTDSTYAAGACRNYTFGNGSKGHLPALGEFNLAYSNKNAVDALITACNKTAMDTSTIYWSSTYYGIASNTANFWVEHWSNGYVSSYGTVSGAKNVRPFTQWKPISTKLHFTATDNSSVANMVLEITDQSNNTVYVKTGSDGDAYLSLDNGTYTVCSFSHSLSIGTFTVTNANVMTTVNISATKMEYVDLGLSVKWATCNLGASSPIESGDYFSWGNIIGHAKGSGYDFTQTDYNSTPGASLTASIASNDSAHDAALAINGSPWRMPTKADVDELISGCTATWVTIDGVNGRIFKSNVNGYTDKKIFIPASGYCRDTTLNDEGSHYYYWSSTYSSSTYAYGYFDSSSMNTFNGSRYCGFTVRAVQ